MRLPSKQKTVPAIAVAAVLAVWQAACSLGLIPAFMLPSPIAVVSALVSDFPLIWSHTVTTLLEAGLGLAIGVVLGFILAVLMDRFETFRLAIQPLITLSLGLMRLIGLLEHVCLPWKQIERKEHGKIVAS